MSLCLGEAFIYAAREVAIVRCANNYHTCYRCGKYMTSISLTALNYTPHLLTLLRHVKLTVRGRLSRVNTPSIGWAPAPRRRRMTGSNALGECGLFCLTRTSVTYAVYELCSNLNLLHFSHGSNVGYRVFIVAKNLCFDIKRCTSSRLYVFNFVTLLLLGR